MQTRQLEYFLAVAEELSFTRAAKRFFISQAALSMQIKSLEQELDARLFDRDKHHVALTPAGLALIDAARSIVAMTDDAVQTVRRATVPSSGTLRLGYVQGYERSNVSKMVSRFHQQYPHVWVELTRGKVSELYDELRAEKLDIVINMFYESAEMGDIEYIEIGKYPLVAVMPYDHPLAGRQLVGIDELRPYPVVKYVADGADYGEKSHIEQVVVQCGLYDCVSCMSRDIETTVLCVLSGFGYALLPGFVTHALSSESRIETVSVKGMEDEIHIVAAWLPNTRNDLIDIFLDNYLLVAG